MEAFENGFRTGPYRKVYICSSYVGGSFFSVDSRRRPEVQSLGVGRRCSPSGGVRRSSRRRRDWTSGRRRMDWTCGRRLMDWTSERRRMDCTSERRRMDWTSERRRMDCTSERRRMDWTSERRRMDWTTKRCTKEPEGPRGMLQLLMRWNPYPMDTRPSCSPEEKREISVVS
ncbi:hypothetical protein Bbelb_326550 [Branchiostoma belcheri]|nr:hypothetical protein Bbelb_326550 [Branchiostoma belcheri]